METQKSELSIINTTTLKFVFNNRCIFYYLTFTVRWVADYNSRYFPTNKIDRQSFVVVTTRPKRHPLKPPKDNNPVVRNPIPI